MFANMKIHTSSRRGPTRTTHVGLGAYICVLPPDGIAANWCADDDNNDTDAGDDDDARCINKNGSHYTLDFYRLFNICRAARAHSVLARACISLTSRTVKLLHKLEMNITHFLVASPLHRGHIYVYCIHKQIAPLHVFVCGINACVRAHPYTMYNVVIKQRR